ncbi:hypothetical protein EBT25_01760 [bacterium]|nr:hypothetical protein [bacterium]
MSRPKWSRSPSPEIEDPNAIWDHALSLQDTKIWIDRQNELDFMKDLFFNKLPINENEHKMEELNDYFNRVQQAIFTKDPNFKYDEFPRDYSVIDIDGAVQRPPTQYKYFSQDLLKQQASYEDGPADSTAIGFSHPVGSEQDMEASSHIVEIEPIPEDSTECTSDNACMEECSNSEDTSEWGYDSDHSGW